MSEESRVQFKFLIPAGLKDRLEAEAAGNRRSLSAEIIARLEASVAVEPLGRTFREILEARVEEMNKRLERIEAEAKRAKNL